MSSLKDWPEQGWTDVLDSLVNVLSTPLPDDPVVLERCRVYCLEGVQELQHRWKMIGRHLEDLGRNYIRDE